jgi:hypothetical protein
MASRDVSVVIRDLPEVRGYIAQLEDAVVAAACMWFGEIEGGSQLNYCSEELHAMATDICARVPRLRGQFKGGDQ